MRRAITNVDHRSGGRHSRYRIGDFEVTQARSTTNYPDLWLIILGGLFIIVVLFLPGGLVSLPRQIARLWKKRGTPESPAPGAGTPAANARPNP